MNIQKAITVKGLIKKYNNFIAVDDVSFEVAKGEIFAFLGPNGAGKTTTIKILTTLLKASAGEVFVNGFDPASEQNEARKSFGIVFQDQSLDDELTGWENMELVATLYGMGKKERRSKIESLLKFVELWDKKDVLAKKYSGGMKRRLEIARGLAHQPEILFLDEPTLGLDPQTRLHIWEYIKQLNKKDGMTVFFTTHYIEEAEKMADRAAIIDKGKIIKIGTPAELAAATGTKSLEEAFLALTGKDIRSEEGSILDRMRRIVK